jgi:anti-sigma B factor antagonist
VNHFAITTHTTTAGTLLELEGELDFDTAAGLREALAALALRPGQQLVIGLGGVTFCDSSGITALIAARNHALGAAGTIALAAVPQRITRIFDITGLLDVFPTFPTVQDAVDAHTAPPTRPA